MSEQEDLHTAFHETLKDVYWAEQHSVKACKKSAKAAKSPELKAAFEEHAEVSEKQVERLKEVFETIDKKPSAKECKAMSGIMAEMEEDMEEFGDTPACDPVLIGCGQAIEHYEMARYGLLATWARQLGNKKAEKLLAETLKEEEATDTKLTKLAERLNAQAIKKAA